MSEQDAKPWTIEPGTIPMSDAALEALERAIWFDDYDIGHAEPAVAEIKRLRAEVERGRSVLPSGRNRPHE